MKPMKWFALSLVLVVLGTASIFLLLYIFCLNGILQNPITVPDKVQALTSIVALVLGTGAAVGGAIATIKVAYLGLEITQRQERVDAIQFLESRIHSVTGIYSRLLVALNRVVICGMAVNLSVPYIDKEHALEEMENKVTPKLLSDLKALNDALTNLIRALDELATDELSMFCYVKNIKKGSGQLAYIVNKLQEVGLQKSEVDVDISDISGICSLFEMSRRRVTDDSLESIIAARLYTNSSDIDIFKKKYDNVNVRSFFFLGNLIFCRTSKYKNNHLFIASYGTAMIRDLVKFIPSDIGIRAALKERYPNLAFAVDKLNNRFIPDTIISSFVKMAIDEADSIGGLYLLMSEEIA